MNVSNQTEQNDYWVDMNDALDRLEENRDFQLVIMQGYFHDLAVNQTSLLASQSTIKNGTRNQNLEKLVSISRLQDHLLLIKDLGARPTVEDVEELEQLDEEIASMEP